jgi:hypothetical protein
MLHCTALHFILMLVNHIFTHIRYTLLQAILHGAVGGFLREHGLERVMEENGQVKAEVRRGRGEALNYSGGG